MKSTIRIKQNNKNTHSMSITNSVLSQIYRSPCTKSYAAYQILSAGNSQSRRVEQYNLKNGISLYNCLNTLNCSFAGTLSYIVNNFESFSQFGFGLAWSPDGTKIAIGAPNFLGTSAGVVYIINATTGSLINTINSINGVGSIFAFCLTWSPDSSKIAVGAFGTTPGNGAVHIINPSNGNLLLTITNPSPSTSNSFGTSVSWSPDGTKIAASASFSTASANSYVFIVNASTGGLINTIASISGNGTGFGFGLAWSPDGSKLAIGTPQYLSGIGIVYIVNPNNGNLITSINSFTNSQDSFGYSVTWSADGTKLAIGSPGYSNSVGIVHIANPTTGVLLSTINSNYGIGGGFGVGLSWSPCTKTGSQLAIGVTGYNNDSGIICIYK
jgi:hypothetical protein